MIVFSDIKRCRHPHFTQIVQKAKKGAAQVGKFPSDEEKPAEAAEAPPAEEAPAEEAA